MKKKILKNSFGSSGRRVVGSSGVETRVGEGKSRALSVPQHPDPDPDPDDEIQVWDH